MRRQTSDKRHLKSSTWSLILLLAVFGIALSSCRRIDFGLMRQEHTEAFTRELAERSTLELSSEQPIGLQQCIEIALRNNLNVKASEIDKRLASLNRKIAFSNFLPHLDASFDTVSSLKHRMVKAGGGYVPMSDQTVTEGTLRAQQAIFAPQTWFLYDAYVKGEDISNLLARRTQNMIRLQVTSLYFSCLLQEESRPSIEASLQKAMTLLSETEALARESLAMPSQIEQLRTMIKTSEAELAVNQEAQRVARAALLEAMGLSPSVPITIKKETPIVVPDQEIEDQI
ncbi:MAG TPA: TolC family protein, partial [bacterium]|nr:TolC family protein [bacterium]